MTTYDNTDRGVLFKNTDKRNENSPDYTGEINVKGTKQSLSAWVQTSKTGMKYLSLKVRDPPGRHKNRTQSSPGTRTRACTGTNTAATGNAAGRADRRRHPFLKRQNHG